MDLTEAPVLLPGSTAPTVPPYVETDERAARRALRDQIARLERELCGVWMDAFPLVELDVSVPAQAGPRLLDLGGLERTRDALAERLSQARAVLAERAEREEASRLLIEDMLLEPGRYRWVRVSNADIGERGCRHWHVRPRRGIIGMLMGWWQVKISSGCPLAEGSRLRP